MAEFNGAFNDIGLVDFSVRTPMGTLEASQLGPNDVVITAQPGNDGNVYEFVEGSTGQALFNKSYKVKNWTVTIRFLRHSYDYAKVTYFIQEVLNGHITMCSLLLRNRNFGPNGDIDDLNETLYAPQAVLQNFAGVEFGAGANGDFEVTFKTSGAEYKSGAYNPWSNSYAPEAMQDRGGSINYAGSVDNYNGVSSVDVDPDNP